MKNQPFLLSNKISTGSVAKYEFQSSDKTILSQGLHFIPSDMLSSILEHTHTSDSERYYKLRISRDNDNNIIDTDWVALEAVSSSTPNNNTHSVECSNEIQIIFGVKRSSNYNKDNWPEDVLPKVDYSNTYDLFRFQLKDEKIFTHSDFEEILTENNKTIYTSPKKSGQSYTEGPSNVNTIVINELAEDR